MELINQKTFPANYSQDVLEVLRALSMTDLKGMTILGSASLRSQQYAGDYDAMESVKGNLAPKLQSVVKQIRQMEGVYFSDIKCGEIAEWNVFHPNAFVVDDVVRNFNRVQSQAKVDALLEDGVLTKGEATKANALLEAATSPFTFLQARKEIRFHILRWKPNEILEGVLRYRGREITLEEAVQSGGMVKVDVIANLHNRFVEFSCIYDEGKVPPLLPSLQEDILYYSKVSPFKALKRVFVLAKVFKKESTLRTLLPLLNSDLGRLYQIIGDMDTLLQLLSSPSPPMKTIRESIDEFRSRLGNIYELKDVLKNEFRILGEIESILRNPSPSVIKLKLEGIKDELQGILNRNTLKQMKSQGVKNPLK